jgi:hypothetical protein
MGLPRWAKIFSGGCPWVIVECFESRHLDGFAEIGYRIESLDTKGNYLLTPPTGVRHAA